MRAGFGVWAPGDEMQTMQYRTSSGAYATETRSYNSRAQLKELASNMPSAPVNLQYIYTAGANNGRIAQMNDVVSGEQTVYTYDSLKRLIKAKASVSLWGQTFGYDGFGNLMSKTPTAGHTGTAMSLSVDTSTNRVGVGIRLRRQRECDVDSGRVGKRCAVIRRGEPDRWDVV